jgi:hypothetical protein
MSSLFPITDEMKTIFRNLYDGSSESLENVINKLKEKGFSQMQSLRLIMQEMNFSISDADKIIMNSKAWGDEKEGNKIFRENFIKAQFSSDHLQNDNVSN